jgi:hypothetical protein
MRVGNGYDFVFSAALAASFNQQIKRMEWGWVFPERQNKMR